MINWTNPITWVFEQVWSATLFNQQIRDNLLYLYNRPAHRIEVAVTQNLTVSIWNKVTGVDLQITLPAATTLMFQINTTLLHASSWVVWRWDIWDVDNSVYLSSGSASPQTYGLGRMLTGLGTVHSSEHLVYLEENVAAGTHNYEVHIYAETATTSIDQDEALCYYMVKDIG